MHLSHRSLTWQRPVVESIIPRPLNVSQSNIECTDTSIFSIFFYIKLPQPFVKPCSYKETTRNEPRYCRLAFRRMAHIPARVSSQFLQHITLLTRLSYRQMLHNEHPELACEHNLTKLKARKRKTPPLFCCVGNRPLPRRFFFDTHFSLQPFIYLAIVPPLRTSWAILPRCKPLIPLRRRSPPPLPPDDRRGRRHRQRQGQTAEQGEHIVRTHSLKPGG